MRTATRHRFRPALRLVALCAALLAVLLLVVGGTVVVARTTQNGYGCLLFEPGRFLVDLNTGFALIDSRPPPQMPAPAGMKSPDGRYSVHLRAADPNNFLGVYALFVESVRTGKMILLQDEMAGSIYYAWSPVGSTLAFAWESQSGQPYAAVVELGSAGVARRIVQPINASVVLGQWSWDGRHYIIRTGSGSAFFVWRIADDRLFSIPLRGELRGFSWSGDGEWLAYLESDATTSWLTLTQPGGEAFATDLGTTLNSYQLVWSPDSRHVALQYMAQWPFWRLGMASLNGTSVRAFAEVAQRGDAVLYPVVTWSADSRQIVYQQNQGAPDNAGRWDLMAYEIETGQQRVLAENLMRSPAAAPNSDRRRIAVPWRSGGKHSLALMDVEGSRRVLLVDGADDMGDPYWSPDGRYLAVVWATGQGQARIVRLTWIRADGSALHTISGDLWDVRDLVWLDDALAYVVWHSDAQGKATFSVEIAVLETGQTRRVAHDLNEVTTMQRDEHGALAFWWRSAEGLIGTDAYTPEGTRLYRFQIVPEPYMTIKGTVQHVDHITTRSPGAPMVFIAPERPGAVRVAALKLYPFGQESLYLAAADGTWSRQISTNLTGLGDPLWAPDGTKVAFTQSVNRGPVMLRIVTAAGEPVRTLEPHAPRYGLQWTKCD